ncbi:MAG: hypothetical protein QM778_37030 [Myxococcales bacterium]
MLRLLAIWSGLFLLLVGCGLSVAFVLERLGGDRFRRPVTTTQAFWFGYVITIAFLQLWSLAFPIRLPALLVLVGLSALGFFVSGDPLRARLRAWRHRPRRVLALSAFTIVIAVVVALYAVNTVIWYDTHLYHLQAVKWARFHPAIPGIANLHSRLAFNNSIHLFAAMTESFWKAQSSHIALGFLTTVVLVQLVAPLIQRVDHRQGRRSVAFALVMVPFLLSRLPSQEVNSLSTDLALELLCIAFIMELLRFDSRREVGLQLALLLGLAAAATTTKLGALALAMTGLALAGFVLRKGGHGARTLLAVALPSALVAVGYVARHGVLSGWLLFPVPVAQLPVSWAYAREDAIALFRCIESWAKIPGVTPDEVLDHGFRHWFDPWFRRIQGSRELLLLAISVLFALLRFASPRGKASVVDRFAIGGVALSLMFWFRGAPDLRFGAVFFWLLLAVLLVEPVARICQTQAGAVVALGLSLALANWAGGIRVGFELPASLTDIPPITPMAATKKVELSPGLISYVTLDGGDQCSNSPLPCTPYPLGQRLREGKNLRAGFLAKPR